MPEARRALPEEEVIARWSGAGLVTAATYGAAMDHRLPAALLGRVNAWSALAPPERTEVARALRSAGLSYGEMMSLIPVPKSTLAGWCRDITLSSEQITAIKTRTGPVAGIPRDTQHKRRAEIAAIRERAAEQVPELMNEPLWVAGTVLYWGEGSKTSNELSLSNSDPSALRLFILWARTYLYPNAEFVMKLNLHHDNDEPAARIWWSAQLSLESADFHKSFIKPDGTGHRKNHLPHGVCLVRMRRSTDALHMALSWIAALGGVLGVHDC